MSSSSSCGLWNVPAVESSRLPCIAAAYSHISSLVHPVTAWGLPRYALMYLTPAFLPWIALRCTMKESPVTSYHAFFTLQCGRNCPSNRTCRCRCQCLTVRPSVVSTTATQPFTCSFHRAVLLSALNALRSLSRRSPSGLPSSARVRVSIRSWSVSATQAATLRSASRPRRSPHSGQSRSRHRARSALGEPSAALRSVGSMQQLPRR